MCITHTTASSFARIASWNWQFSKLQRDYATYRLEIEAGDTEESVGGWEGFKMAVTDIKTYFLMGILSLTYVAGAVNSFFPSVVATLGFSSNNTLLLTAPPFLFCTLCMFFNGWHADRTNERALHVAIPLTITIVSMVMAISSTAVGVRYVRPRRFLLVPKAVLIASFDRPP